MAERDVRRVYLFNNCLMPHQFGFSHQLYKMNGFYSNVLKNNAWEIKVLTRNEAYIYYSFISYRCLLIF